MHIKGEEEIYADEYDISDHDERQSHSLNRNPIQKPLFSPKANNDN